MRASAACSTEPEGTAPRPKLLALLEAARARFLEDGYAAASVDAIAREAGVSKATLYGHFPSKEALFEAVVVAQCRRHASAVEALDTGGDDVAGTLAELARALLRFLLEPDSIAIYRVVAAESARTPELGRTFYEAGPARLQARLAAYLRRMGERGMLSVPEPEIAAVELISLIRAELHLKALFAFERLPGAGRDRAQGRGGGQDVSQGVWGGGGGAGG